VPGKIPTPKSKKLSQFFFVEVLPHESQFFFPWRYFLNEKKGIKKKGKKDVEARFFPPWRLR
jgi:hypothetical protein